MRGGAYLAGLDQAMVIDVGGTTTDVGELKNGFPREANSVVKIGGVRTLFRMPDLDSIGLGGGSHVSLEPLKIGPLSVGYRLLSDGIAFGGTLTSDVAIAAGYRISEPHAWRISRKQPGRGCWAGQAHDREARSHERKPAVPLIAVGGGAFTSPKSGQGVSRVIRVRHGDCANAVGAAIAQVSGEVDQVFRDLPRSEAIAKAAALAADRAVAAGANRATLETVETEDIPIAYLPGNSIRVRVRGVGDVAGRISANASL
jgi:N-methylhydantoinase A/oxoprolinase/acetone carboxylase beta subunit